MMRIREAIARFMYGRNGSDQICYAALIAYSVLMLVNVFTHSTIVDAADTMLAVYIFFRMLSRNISRRRAENAKFVQFLSAFKQSFQFSAKRFREIGTHRYRQCPQCKAMLRLPRKVGKHTAVCPRCRHEFAVRIQL
jgi:hypothetical protein